LYFDLYFISWYPEFVSPKKISIRGRKISFKERGREIMKRKTIMALVVTIGFILSFVNFSYGGAEKIEAKGTVAKVEGQTVILKVDKGEKIIVKLEDVKGIEVGDRIEIKDGVFSILDKATGKVKDTRKLKIDRPI
jgi:hypothetical protein